MIIQSEEYENIINKTSLKKSLKSLRMIVQPVFLWYDRDALTREGPRGEPIATPSICL